MFAGSPPAHFGMLSVTRFEARSWLVSNELAHAPSNTADATSAITARVERLNVLTRRTDDGRQRTADR